MRWHSAKTIIEDDLAELAVLSRAELAGRWRRRLGREPPKGCGRSLLELAEAYAIQAAAFGALKPSLRRQLETQVDGSSKFPSARRSKIAHLRILLIGQRTWAQTTGRRCGVQSIETDASTELHLRVVPYSLKRRGVEAKLIVSNEEVRPAFVDKTLVEAISQAHLWLKKLSTGAAKSAAEIAAGAGIDDGEVSRVLPLAFLAPDIVEVILKGRQPVMLMARHLKRLKPVPTSWSEQRRILGF